MIKNQIINSDILDYLSSLPDKCVDFCFSDPPYNASKDYGVYKDNLPYNQYVNWMGCIIDEYERISRYGMAFFVGSKRIKLFWDCLPDAKLIIVRKGAISTPRRDYYLQYSGLLVNRHPNQCIYDIWDGVRMPGEGYFFKEPRYPHPGLTSLQLTSRVMRHFTNKDELVYDGFMGTGTTAVACKLLGRNYLGTELNNDYIKIANERLNTSQMEFNFDE